MIIFVLNSGYSFTILAGFMHFIAIHSSPNLVEIRKAKNFKILLRSIPIQSGPVKLLKSGPIKSQSKSVDISAVNLKANISFEN